MAEEIEPDEAERLAARLAELGASDPRGMARRVLEANDPYLAKILLLRQMWQIILGYRDAAWVNRIVAAGRDGAIKRMVSCGAEVDDIARVAGHVAMWSMLQLVHRLDNGPDDFEDTGWTLVETKGGEATGRALNGLHEEFQLLDPRGLDGKDLLEEV